MKINNCSVCKSKARIFTKQIGERTWYMCACSNMSCLCGKQNATMYDTERYAITQWNEGKC